MADLGSDTSLVIAINEIEKKVIQAEKDRNDLETNLGNKGVNVIPGSKMSNLIDTVPSLKVITDIPIYGTGTTIFHDSSENISNYNNKTKILEYTYNNKDGGITLSFFTKGNHTNCRTVFNLERTRNDSTVQLIENETPPGNSYMLNTYDLDVCEGDKLTIYIKSSYYDFKSYIKDIKFSCNYIIK